MKCLECTKYEWESRLQELMLGGQSLSWTARIYFTLVSSAGQNSNCEIDNGCFGAGETGQESRFIGIDVQ